MLTEQELTQLHKYKPKEAFASFFILINKKNTQKSYFCYQKIIIKYVFL